MLFGKQQTTPFSIMNKLSIENLTTTPVDTGLLEISDNDSLVIDTMEVFDSHPTDDTESLYLRSFNEHTNEHIFFNHTSFRSAHITSNDDVRSIILQQKTRPKARSFFGLIIIPCKNSNYYHAN